MSHVHRPAPGPGRARRVPRTALACGLAAALAACGGRGGGDTVTLGLAVPLTDAAGAEDLYGVRSKMGAELAVEELNARRAPGQPALALRVVNDKGDPAAAIAVADSLVADPAVLAVVGHVYSGTTLKAAERYQGHLAAVATSATSPDITRLGDWIFRVASSDSSNAVSLAGMARTMGTRIGVLYANDDYGQGLARNFVAALRAAGVQPAEVDPFLGDTPDFTPYLRRMQARGVDLVFLAGLQDPAARAIAQAQALGMRARFVGGDGVEGLAGMGPRYDGTGVGLLFHPDMSDSSRAFAARYRARYGQDPDSQAALAYDAVRLLAGAVRDGRRTPAEVRAWLAGVGREGGPSRYAGVAGDVAFDQNGDPVNKQFTLGVIRGGRAVLPESRR